jgi:multiple sugar transport system substrate-binding protein
MKTSHARLIALYNFCSIVILMAACVPATPTATAATSIEPNARATPKERVVIRLLVDMYAEPALVDGVEAFNASQDDIQLELMIEQVEYDWLVTQLRQRAENGGGNLPDLIGPWSMDHLHMYPDPWLDLSPYLDGDDLAAFDPNALRGWQNADGQLLGLPLTLHPWVIFYNRDLFDAAGLPYPPDRPGEPYADGEAWTIEKMESIAIQLTLDGYGRTPASPDFDPTDVKQYGLTHVPYCAGEITALFGNPQPSIAADGKITLPEPWKEAIRWYYSAMWEKHFIPPAGAVDLWTALDSGQAAMVYAGTWYLDGDETLQTWDLAPAPAYNSQIFSYTGTLGLAAISTTQHPREAARALLYLASRPEVFHHENSGLETDLPARPDLQPAFLAELDARYPQGVNWQVIVDSLPYSQYADYNTYNNPLCQDEFMKRLSETPGLDLEFEFQQVVFSK